MYNFDDYLDDRSKKDNKFEKMNEKDVGGEEEEKTKDKDEEEGSEFSISEEDEEMSQDKNERNGGEEWDSRVAENMYRMTKDDIETKYFVV